MSSSGSWRTHKHSFSVESTGGERQGGDKHARSASTSLTSSDQQGRARMAVAAPQSLSESVQSSGTAMASGSPPKNESLNVGANGQSAKLTSPSKGALGGRMTYDPKLVSREMHRLGNLTHIPASIGASLSSVASASSMSLPLTTIPMASSSSNATLVDTSGDNPWGKLHTLVLPLFDGEPLRVPIEDLNALVKKHIQHVISQSPSKALGTLESDLMELLAAGMFTLKAKFENLDDERLLQRVVEVWGFFWDTVLPYVQGAFLPLQTDSLLLSLVRVPKSATLDSGSPYIDTRKLALRAFRDRLIATIADRLHEQLLNTHLPPRQSSAKLTRKTQGLVYDSSETQALRIQQMLLVCSSVAELRGNRAANATIPQGEVGVRNLLKMLRVPPASTQEPLKAPERSFLSQGMPRDRRGRVASRDEIGHPHGPRELTKGREFLDSLRSPDPEHTSGGWGLGPGRDARTDADEED